jgi:hypothetical protein
VAGTDPKRNCHIYLYIYIYIYMGMGHLLSWVPDGIFEGVRTQKKKESGSLQ